MKRIVLLLTLFISITAFAKDLNNDVTMVSYEQSWIDHEGTLALKNNTNEEIRNVVFLITYLDMSGKELDYEEFSEFVSIAPGMTKKINIPAYEAGRFYHYYKSKGDGENPAFKINFQLKDYNVPNEELSGSDDSDYYGSYNDTKSNSESDIFTKGFFITIIIILLVAISVSVGLFVLVALMAQRRHRNVVLWVLLSILASPLLMIIILLIIGDDPAAIENNNGWK